MIRGFSLLKMSNNKSPSLKKKHSKSKEIVKDFKKISILSYTHSYLFAIAFGYYNIGFAIVFFILLAGGFYYNERK